MQKKPKTNAIQIIKVSYLYFVCIMKQCQNLYILNILVTLNILQLAKIKESNFTFTTNISMQYREKGLEKRGVYQ